MGGLPWYCTREDVQTALEAESTAGTRFTIDSAVAGASRGLERSAAPGLGRAFHPRYETRYENWPDRAQTSSARLYLSQPLIEATLIMSGGSPLAVATDVFLEPAKDEPCAHVLALAIGSHLSSGNDPLRSMAITGLWGYHDEQKTCGAVATAGIATTTGTTFDLAGGDLQAPGVGHLVKVDDERMIVTDKRMVDTGVNIGADLAVSLAASILVVADGTLFAPGETLMVDSERLWIRDVIGNNLYVRRAYDGTALAAHTTGADIYAARRLVVERGAVGSTAATHAAAAVVTRWDCPAPVQNFALALAVNECAQRVAQYSRTVGEGETLRESRGWGLRQAADNAKGYRRPMSVYS